MRMNVGLNLLCLPELDEFCFSYSFLSLQILNLMNENQLEKMDIKRKKISLSFSSIWGFCLLTPLLNVESVFFMSS